MGSVTIIAASRHCAATLYHLHPRTRKLCSWRDDAPGPQVLRSDILYDCGNSLNPVIDVGQAEGAFVMGQGYFMQEEILQGFDGVLASEDTWEHEPGLLTC